MKELTAKLIKKIQRVGDTDISISIYNPGPDTLQKVTKLLGKGEKISGKNYKWTKWQLDGGSVSVFDYRGNEQ